MEVIKYRVSPDAEWLPIMAIKGEPGKDGTMSFDDLTEEQKASLKGEPGADGKDGVDGKDYVLTDNDKQEIANLVIASLPNSEEVSY